MSAVAMGWAWQHSPYTGSALTVHLALADIANDVHDYELWTLTKTIAAKARVNPGTARRTLLRMVDDGYLELLDDQSSQNRASRYRFLMPDEGRASDATGTPTGRAPRATGRAHDATGVAHHARPVAHTARPKEHKGELNDQLKPNTAAELPLGPEVDPPKPVDPVDARARQIVDEVWKRKDPRPATPYIGCVKIARALLDAGHDPQAIGRAMVAVPTISTRWVEAEIARAKPPNRSAGMITDRDGPSRVLTDAEVWGDEA